MWYCEVATGTGTRSYPVYSIVYSICTYGNLRRYTDMWAVLARRYESRRRQHGSLFEDVKLQSEIYFELLRVWDLLYVLLWNWQPEKFTFEGCSAKIGRREGKQNAMWAYS